MIDFLPFSKGDNFYEFLHVFLNNNPFPKMGLLYKERICSHRKQFPFRVDLISERRKQF